MRLLLALLAALPLPLLAQEPLSIAPPARQFALPPGCTAYLTVQMASCTLSHHFHCAGDPEGWQRRVDLDEGGVSYFGAIDSETQWMESTHVLAGHTERLEPAPADPASFSGLIATGIDTYDFQTLSDQAGTQRFIGQDRLTGRSVVIDGVTLEETDYAIRALDASGTEMWRSAGLEYINRDFRMFLSGRSSITTADETFEVNDSPVEFVFPDEAGFLSATPHHGCGVVLSKRGAS